MNIILVLVRKDLANFFRNRSAVVLTFVIPFVLIWIFGWVFGVNRKDPGPAGIPLGVVDDSANGAGAPLVSALEQEASFKVVRTVMENEKERPLREEDLRQRMRDNEFRFAVVLPRDLISERELGLHVKVYTNPRNEIETQLVNGVLQRTIFAHVPQLLGQSLLARGRGIAGAERMDSFNAAIADQVAKTFGGDPVEIRRRIESGDFGGAPASGGAAGKTDQSSLLTRLMRIESIQVAGQEVKSPAATRIVGGWAMQFLLFALSSAAAALFYERDHGIFHRLLAGPVSRAHILWSKFAYGVVIGLLQLLTLFFAGRLLYGIDVEHHLGLLILTCVVAAAACTAIGMLLASLTTTPEAASGLSTFVILVMCAIGGAWFPVTLMPEFIQKLSKLTVVYWAMEAFSAVLWADAGILQLLPMLGILSGIGALMLAVAMWRFRRGNLFL